MRLARGSGLDGLAAMAPWIEVGAPPGPVRCESSGRCWGSPRRGCEPPWRRAASRGSRTRATSRRPSSAPAGAPRAATLEALGLSSEMLALERAAAAAGARGARGRDRRLLRRGRGPGAHRSLRLLPHRPGEVAPGAGGDRRARDRPVHRGGRRIGRAGAAGASSSRSSPGCGTARPREPDSWTLARAQITAAGEVIQVEREPGRLALPVMTVAGGAKVLWDGRFAIEIADGLEGSLEVRALGGAGLAELKRLGCAVKGSVGAAPGALVLARKRPPRRAGHRFLGARGPRQADFGRLHGLAIQLRRIRRSRQGRSRSMLKQQETMAFSTLSAARRACVCQPGRGRDPCLANILYTPMLNAARTSPSGGAGVAGAWGQVARKTPEA